MLKRTLSIIIAMLVLSSLAIIPISVSAVSASLIDTTQTGTLNIYKYEMDDVTDADYPGTGTTADASHIPASATPYPGVTFTIKKIAGISPTYFTKDGVALPTPTAAANMAVLSTSTAVTNSSGYASFSGLDLGIYLVQETNAPSQTTGRVADFVVSLPRTNTAGTGWDYTVTVYPKNETSYSDLTILKSDYSNDDPLQGATFKLQKQDGANWTDVESGLTTSASGTVSPTAQLSYNTLYRVEETAAPSSYILDYANRYTEFYVNSSGQISDPTTHVALDASNPSLLKITNSKPAIAKYIDKSNGSNTASQLKTETTFGYNGVGSNAYYYYTIEVTTPDVDMTSMSELKVTDTVASTYGPPVQLVSVTKKSDGSALASGQYTSSISSNNVTFNFKTGTGSTVEKNTTYYISYKALLRADAGTKVSNTATLSYSTDTNDSTKKSTMNSNTTQLGFGGYQALKVNPSDSPLSGVTFKLYPTLADARDGKNAVTAYTSASGTTSGTTFTTDSNGYLNINGVYYGDDIDNGSKTYYLVETSTLTGYNLMSDPLAIVINKSSHLYANTSCKIVNSLKTNLPLTGGYGAIALYGIGGFLIVSGTSTLIVRRVKRKKKSN